MNKVQKAELILKRLNELYPNPKIPLNHSNDFTLLVAVILSAQSTDKKVNELTIALFNLAKDPYALYSLGEAKVYSLIKQLGLSKQKASYLSRMSKILINQYSGKVPKTFKELEALPGVGHKTASVVMAQAFGIATFPVDTHIHRLAQRWELTNGKSVLQTEKDLKLLFAKKDWNRLHLQIIYYGREFCTARGCDGTICRLCKELFPKRNSAVLIKKP